MFGGLEVKDASATSTAAATTTTTTSESDGADKSGVVGTTVDAEVHVPAAPVVTVVAPPEDSIGSAFSFLQTELEPAPTLAPLAPPEPPASAPDPAPAPVTDPAAPALAPAPSSGFSFLSNAAAAIDSVSKSIDGMVGAADTTTTATTSATTAPPPPPPPPAADATKDAVGENGGASAAISGFSFLSTPTPTPAATRTEATDATTTTTAPDVGGSGFSFLSRPAAPASETVVEPKPAAPSSSSSGFGSTLGDAPAPPPPAAPADVLSSVSSDLPPAGSGIVFGGAAKKTTIKKRRAGKKVGVGANRSAAASSSSNSSLPEPSRAMPDPTPPAVAPATTTSSSSVPSSRPDPTPPPSVPAYSSPPRHADSSSSSLTSVRISSARADERSATTAEEAKKSAKDEAERQRRVSEEFIAQKMRESAAAEAEAARNDDTVSPTYRKARAAAEEAERLQKQRPSRNVFGNMGSIFGKSRLTMTSFGSANTGNQNASVHGGGGGSTHSTHSSGSLNANNDPPPQPSTKIEPTPEPVASNSAVDAEKSDADAPSYTVPSYGVQRDVDERVPRQDEVDEDEERRRREREEAERRRREEERREDDVRRRREEEDEERRRREDEERRRREDEEARRAEAEAALPRNVLSRLLADFAVEARRAADGVVDLRRRRATLVVERETAQCAARSAARLAERAAARQTAAAEAEDFETAEDLEEVVAGHERRREESARLAEEARRATEELDRQRDGVVEGVAACFRRVRGRLEDLRAAQDETDKTDSSEALDCFAATSKRLSAETERLNNDVKHIERDESIAEEERKELESTISEQSKDTEDALNDTKLKLNSVNDDVERLRSQLAAKEAAAAQLAADVSRHEEDLARVRSKFHRQLARVGRKETTVRENREEFEAERRALVAAKDAHEQETTAHAEALLSRERTARRTATEIRAAEKAETFWTTTTTSGTEEEDDDDDPAEAGLVEHEARVAEARERVDAAEGAARDLREEMDRIDERLPVLEAEKKTAASKRDFKGAGRASKDVKALTARRKECEETLRGEAEDRTEAAKNDLARLEAELETKREEAKRKEKEKGTKTMRRYAAEIKELEERKRDIAPDVSDDDDDEEEPLEVSVTSVGIAVLDGEIEVLRSKGEAIGEEHGGWEDILSAALANDDGAEKEETDAKETNGEVDPSEEADRPDDPEESALEPPREDDENEPTDPPKNNDDDDDGDGDTDAPTEPSVADLERVRQLRKRLKETERSLGTAVENEEYEEAAELDEVIETIKSQIAESGLTNEQLESIYADEDDE